MPFRPFMPIRISVAGALAACLFGCSSGDSGAGDAAGADSGSDSALADAGDDTGADAADASGDVEPTDSSAEDVDSGPPGPPGEVVIGATWLHRPRALAFRYQEAVETQSKGDAEIAQGWQLWVTSAGDDALVLAMGWNDGAVAPRRFYDFHHRFADNAAGIAFDTEGNVVTCADSDGSADGTRPADLLVGPAVWPSDPERLASRVELAPHGGPLEAFRGSALCTGLVAVDDGFYLINGERSLLEYADFRNISTQTPQDGYKLRFVDVEIGRLEGVVAGMHFDADARVLRVVDPAMARVLAIPIDSGAIGAPIFVNPDPGTELYRVEGTTVQEWLPAGEFGMQQPGGLTAFDGDWVVADVATGVLHRVDAGGAHVGSVDTMRGANAVSGLAEGPDGDLWFTDVQRHEVVRMRRATLEWAP